MLEIIYLSSKHVVEADFFIPVYSLTFISFFLLSQNLFEIYVILQMNHVIQTTASSLTQKLVPVWHLTEACQLEWILISTWNVRMKFSSLPLCGVHADTRAQNCNSYISSMRKCSLRIKQTQRGEQSKENHREIKPEP